MVRSRLLDIMVMTRWRGGCEDGVRGAGNGERDLKISVVELVWELVQELGFLSSKLVRMFRGLARQQSVWVDMIPIVQRLGDAERELLRV